MEQQVKNLALQHRGPGHSCGVDPVPALGIPICCRHSKKKKKKKKGMKESDKI